MQHKNLVRLLGVILHQGLYIVMEHVSKVGGAGPGCGQSRIGDGAGPNLWVGVACGVGLGGRGLGW